MTNKKQKTTIRVAGYTKDIDNVTSISIVPKSDGAILCLNLNICKVVNKTSKDGKHQKINKISSIVF